MYIIVPLTIVKLNLFVFFNVINFVVNFVAAKLLDIEEVFFFIFRIKNC